MGTTAREGDTMQLILTRYLGPTNRHGSRIVASCEARRRIFTWDYSLDVEPNHRKAAERLCAELGWGSIVGGGSLPTGGYAWLPTRKEIT